MKIFLAGVAGFAVGYIVCKQHLEGKYMQMANEEAAASEMFYKQRYASTGDEAVEAYKEKVESDWEKIEQERFADAAEALRLYQGETVGQQLQKNYAAGLQPVPAPVIPDLIPTQRDESKPFIITDEEFLQGDADYAGYTLTYYVKDDVLVGQNDQILEGEERQVAIGEGAPRFGDSSNDENIVYIRNHRLQVDFEVAKSEGSYAEEVLGL